MTASDRGAGGHGDVPEHAPVPGTGAPESRTFDPEGALDTHRDAFDPEEALDERLAWGKSTVVAMAGCVLVGLLEAAHDYVIGLFEETPRTWGFVIARQVPWWVMWMIFMPAVIWLARSYRFDGPRWRRSAVVHALFGLTLALAHGTSFAVRTHFLQLNDGVTLALDERVRLVLLRFLFQDLLTYCTTVGVYYAFEYFTGFRRSALAAARSEARAARLRLSLAEARIHALRMELNPHFLFNALNAVAGLVRKREHDAAIDTLQRLGDLLRTTLNRDAPSEVSLAEELELLRRFLDIELVRFGDRLRVAWEIEPDTYAAYVPPLILQPLVENALRHGISRRQGAALLRVTARRVGQQLELAVRDTGEGLSFGGRQPREGIGLSNTRQRLVELYGAEATSLELSDVAGGGVRARMVLPYHLTRNRLDVALGA